MKTIKEVFGYGFRCDVYGDGTLYPSSAGLLYPDDEVWRISAQIEFQKVPSQSFHFIYDYLDSHKLVINKEFEALYRFYPVFHHNGYATVVINGKPTTIRAGKLLRKCFVSISDFHVRELVDSLTISDSLVAVTLTRNEEEIKHAYNRVRSCMSGSELPLRYLQDSSCYLAVVKQQGKTIGRCWVRNGDRTQIYAFGLYREVVKQALSEFQENSYFLEGVRFLSSDGKFPYIDSCYGRGIYKDSIVTITPEGLFKISEDGYIIR